MIVINNLKYLLLKLRESNFVIFFQEVHNQTVMLTRRKIKRYVKVSVIKTSNSKNLNLLLSSRRAIKMANPSHSLYTMMYMINICFKNSFTPCLLIFTSETERAFV